MTEKEANGLTGSSSGCDLGWNDPPMFSYESHLQYAHVRGPTLTKRVGLSWDSTSPSSVPPPVTSSSSPPGASLPPPPLSSKFAKIPTTTANKTSPSTKGDDADDIPVKDVTLEDVAAGLAEAVNEIYCEEKEKEKSEINKRLQLIETMWREEKLCLEIQQKLGRIVKALDEGKFDDCDSLQRSLMVDHPSVCSPWMAAIRKLISAKRDKSTV